MQPWLTHTLERIEQASLSRTPWPTPHLRIADAFPADFYAEMLRQLPTYDRCIVTEKPWRHFFFRDAAANDPFWRQVFDGLCGPEMVAALARKFAVAGASADICLMRDEPGNVLGPHTDMPPKTLTGLFYLPETDAHADYGTSLFVSRSGRQCDGSRDHEFSADFQRVDKVRYLPNTGFFFAKTLESWHAAERTKVPRSLINIEINP